MSNKNRSEQHWLEDIFRDDAADLYLHPESTTLAEDGKLATLSTKFAAPILEPQPTAADAELRAYWKTLRAFFRTGKGGGLKVEDGHFPALLAPYRSAAQAGPYPCWITDTLLPEGTPQVHTTRSLVEQAVATFAADPAEGKILKDNIARLDFILKKQLAGTDNPQPLRPAIDEALDTLVLQLKLSGSEGDVFLNDVNALRKALPAGGKLIPHSPCAPFYLLAILLDLQADQQKEILKQNTAPLIARIQQMLAVEREKDPAAHGADSLESSMDFAGSFLNFDELAAVMPTGGSVAMPDERLHRLEQVLKTLEHTSPDNWLHKPTVLIAKRLTKNSAINPEEIFPNATVEVVSGEKAFKRITNLFDEKMQAVSALFAAMRIANLELEEHYQHEVHNDFFAHFTHTDFTEAEWALCLPFILAVHSAELVHFGLNDFSALLASNRPVKCLALKFDAFGHVAPPDSSGKTDPVFRQEPAALAVAHRDAYTLQATLADPARLVAGLWEGLHNPGPAFFYTLAANPRLQPVSNAQVWSSAALGGREFPFFTYDNRKGPKWGSRFDIASNPEPEGDWPDEPLLYTTSDGSHHSERTAFTFADFAALDPAFAHYFSLVPAIYWTDDLILLANYLDLPVQETYSKVPFVWIVDAENNLQKAAVALPLVQTALERLDFWHYLQENAGIRSFHVEQASEQLRREFETTLEQQLTELQETHQQEIEKVREESARTAMEQLAGYLLDLDLGVDAPMPVVRPVATEKVGETRDKQIEPPPAPESDNKTAPAKAPEPVALSAEAWIETPLCTSCNECINLNGRLFKYNGDKQAFVADPAAGTFAELVKAAEECPVAIIHPGAPLNPKEPGLDALIPRAAKFN
ncbi:MAG: ferredoxin [Lewinellaceae bacterium]|nr:ferredoxin [Lewinellaceae bacterium]